MRPLTLLAAGLLLGAVALAVGGPGIVLGVGGLLTFGYGYGRFPRRRPTDPEWEEALARGVVDPEAKAAFFGAFRARSRAVERALRDTSRRPHPDLALDPRHPRLAEAMEMLRQKDGEG